MRLMFTWMRTNMPKVIVDDTSAASRVYLNVDDTSVRAGNGSSHSQRGARPNGPSGERQVTEGRASLQEDHIH